MIKIDLNSERRKTEGTMQVHGDYEELTKEIYLILVTLAKECPGPFDDAVEKHLQDMMEELEDGKE